MMFICIGLHYYVCSTSNDVHLYRFAYVCSTSNDVHLYRFAYVCSTSNDIHLYRFAYVCITSNEAYPLTPGPAVEDLIICKLVSIYIM